MIKCLQCTRQRTFDQIKVLRTLRTSNQVNIKTVPEKGILATLPKSQEADPNISDEFKTVFNFRYIQQFALINRLKTYQAGITAIFTSGALVLNQLNYISTELFQIVATTGIAGCVPLYTMGLLTRNFIGYIYYNEKTDMARISYIDTWGRRKDLELPANDIIPLEDLPVHRWHSLWSIFSRYSTKDTLRINTKHVSFVDEELLSKVI